MTQSEDKVAKKLGLTSVLPKDAIIREYSPEYGRLMREFGAHVFASPAEYREALKDAMQREDPDHA